MVVWLLRDQYTQDDHALWLYGFSMSSSLSQLYSPPFPNSRGGKEYSKVWLGYFELVTKQQLCKKYINRYNHLYCRTHHNVSIRLAWQFFVSCNYNIAVHYSMPAGYLVQYACFTQTVAQEVCFVLVPYNIHAITCNVSIIDNSKNF